MSDTVATPSVIPHAPLEIISATNKSGLIVLITALLLSFTLVSFLIRLYVRLRISGPWRGDDSFLSIGTVLALTQSAVVFAAAHHGLGKTGKDLDDSQLAQIGKDTYASDFLYLVSLSLSKCSIAFLFLRLTPRKSHALVSWSTIAASAIWAFVSILLISISCSATDPWTGELVAQCSSILTRWRVIAAFDIITEVALFGIAVYLVAELQMHWKFKATVIVVFSLRLPVIAAASLRLHYLATSLQSSDPTLDAANTVVWTQVELDYALLACTLPCLGPFIRPFAVGPAQESRYAYPASGSGSGNWHSGARNGLQHSSALSGSAASGIVKPSEYDLANLSPDRPNPKRQNYRNLDKSHGIGVASTTPGMVRDPRGKGRLSAPLRPEPVSNKTDCTADDDRRGSMVRDERSVGSHGSSGSQEMIIKKKMAWSVDIEGQP